MNKLMALCLTASVAAVLSSCSAAASPTDGHSPEGTPSSAVTAAPSASATLEPASSGGIPVSGVTSTSKGQYLQTTIDDSSPAWSLDPAIVDPSAAPTDPADLLAGYRHILKFMAEEGIDSPANGGAQSPAEWWAEHEAEFAAQHSEDLRQGFVEQGEGLVMTEARWQQGERFGGAYQYVHDPTRPRLLTRDIAPTKVWNPTAGSITVAVEALVTYTMAVRPAPGTTAELTQFSTGTMSYSATKDPTDGQWRIDGFLHAIDTTEAW